MKYTEQRTSSIQRLFDVVYRLPGDLFLVAGFVAIADVIMYVGPSYQVLEFIVGLPLLFFLPGYVLLAIIFPRAPGQGTASGTSSSRLHRGAGVAFSHRLVLSFGTSVALIPLLAVGMGFAGIELTLETITGLFSILLLVGTLVGAFNRLRVAPNERMRVPIRRWVLEFVDYVTGGGNKLDAGLNVLLVICVLVGMSGFAFAVAAPPSDSDYANFMLLTRGSEGEFVASGYPTEFTRGQAQSLVVAVENKRDRQVPYEVVVEIQRVRGDASDFSIVERREITRFQRVVEPGATWYRPHTIAPRMMGDDLRLAYYLYAGEAPQRVPAQQPDQHLHLWVNVSIGS